MFQFCINKLTDCINFKKETWKGNYIVMNLREGEFNRRALLDSDSSPTKLRERRETVEEIIADSVFDDP